MPQAALGMPMEDQGAQAPQEPSDEEVQNALGAPGSEQDGSSPAGRGLPGPRGIEAEHDFLAAQYAKLKQTSAQVAAMQMGLQRLGVMRDMVTPEDVVEEAGQLAAVGVSPTQLASILAEMPTANGEVLSQWLGQQSEGLAQASEMLQMQMSVTRYALGGAAMKMIAGAHLMSQGYANGPSAPSGPNPLMTAGGE